MFPGEQIKGFENSLKLLQMDYVDLYLIHWPVAGKTLGAWKNIWKRSINPDGRGQLGCAILQGTSFRLSCSVMQSQTRNQSNRVASASLVAAIGEIL